MRERERERVTHLLVFNNYGFVFFIEFRKFYEVLFVSCNTYTHTPLDTCVARA